MLQLENLCIIPARGGSKRIPRKNIKNFLGKPIITYTIQTALKSGLFNEVMVSTEDEEIAHVSSNAGAEVPFFRSKSNAGDIAPTVDVVNEVINCYKQEGKLFKNVCIIYPTAPFVLAEDLKAGLIHLNRFKASIPVVSFSFPVWRAFSIKNENVQYNWPEHQFSRSQDLEELYHDAGQWYWLKNDDYLKTLVPENTAPVYIDPIRVQDIDTLEDWKIAEFKYGYLQSA